MNLSQLRDLASSVGFPASALDVAAAVAMAESGGNPAAVGDEGTSFGLWQVHTPAHPEYSAAELFDPTENARAALAISRGGSDWHPWSTFTSGAYLKFLRRTTNWRLVGAGAGAIALVTGAVVLALRVAQAPKTKTR
jgi:lysozyme-like protein